MTDSTTHPASPGLESIDYSHAPKAVYYVPSTGDRWREHGCVLERGKLWRVGLSGAERSTSRVFVAKSGVRKLYRRVPRDIWEATAADLDRQRTVAEYSATMTFIPEMTTPR